ncbi:hypothetical protein SAMD00019534_121200 [Acytostelium subglobosum LB1]|uniref:hypothetical protein n=1 Tax=Acytostelium subglobosum LB1 TaxID=1410327 RepID=UPI000644A40C|nr:hypothetical protein SAMD00019534_121200 [Acytostelium subglobosum LB1]GAM28944.1 hypothetical protein SAMD00019534_121200 [Acytostelium subglobosum LB1]|eukprot:XP_012748129.1 hypothetical protein SAMD00019534_121200 [Acytostelium subglobosum LB1]
MSDTSSSPSSPSSLIQLPHYVLARIVHYSMVDHFVGIKWKMTMFLVCKVFAEHASAHLTSNVGDMFLKSDFGVHLASPNFAYRYTTAFVASLHNLRALYVNHPDGEQLLAKMMSQTTHFAVYSGASEIDPSHDNMIRTVYRMISERPSLSNICLQSSIVHHYPAQDFPLRHLTSLIIMFLGEVDEHNSTLLGLLKDTAPTLKKLSFLSALNTRQSSYVPPGRRATSAVFFERVFDILANARCRLTTLKIKRLYLGDLGSLLRGLSTQKHIEKLKVTTLATKIYSQAEIDNFNAGLIAYLKTLDHPTILHLPFSVRPDHLVAISAQPSIFYLQGSLMEAAPNTQHAVVLPKLPDNIQKLWLQYETTPAAFTSFLKANTASNLLQLFLYDHHRYLTAHDNFDQFLDFLRAHQRLSSLFIGDYKHLTNDLKDRLINVVVGETKLESILIGRSNRSEGREQDTSVSGTYMRAHQDFDGLRDIFGVLARYPLSSIDNIEFEVSDHKMIAPMMKERQMDTGDFIGQFVSRTCSYNYIRFKQQLID